MKTLVAVVVSLVLSYTTGTVCLKSVNPPLNDLSALVAGNNTTYLLERITQLSETISAENDDVINVSSYSDEDPYRFVALTEMGVIYQAHWSADGSTWKPFGCTFRGNGSYRMISLEPETSANADRLMVRLVTL